jgi:hypothetical protein
MRKPVTSEQLKPEDWMECRECGQKVFRHKPSQAFVCCDMNCSFFGLLQLSPGVIDSYAQTDANKPKEAGDE